MSAPLAQCRRTLFNNLRSGIVALDPLTQRLTDSIGSQLTVALQCSVKTAMHLDTNPKETFQLLLDYRISLFEYKDFLAFTNDLFDHFAR